MDELTDELLEFIKVQCNEMKHIRAGYPKGYRDGFFCAMHRIKYQLKKKSSHSSVIGQDNRLDHIKESPKKLDSPTEEKNNEN